MCGCFNSAEAIASASTGTFIFAIKNRLLFNSQQPEQQSFSTNLSLYTYYLQNILIIIFNLKCERLWQCSKRYYWKSDSCFSFLLFWNLKEFTYSWANDKFCAILFLLEWHSSFISCFFVSVLSKVLKNFSYWSCMFAHYHHILDVANKWTWITVNLNY